MDAWQERTEGRPTTRSIPMLLDDDVSECPARGQHVSSSREHGHPCLEQEERQPWFLRLRARPLGLKRRTTPQRRRPRALPPSCRAWRLSRPHVHVHATPKPEPGPGFSSSAPPAPRPAFARTLACPRRANLALLLAR